MSGFYFYRHGCIAKGPLAKVKRNRRKYSEGIESLRRGETISTRPKIFNL